MVVKKGVAVNCEDLSVIIPTYNRSDLLLRAVGSVIKQTRGPREIIIVDDGSLDNTRTHVNSLKKESSIPIVYMRQENRGPAAARNRGIEKSVSSYIAFLDSDDHWHKNKIKTQFNELSGQKNCRISHTRETWFRRGKHLNQKRIHEPADGYIFERCLSLCCVGMSTVMLKKTIFDDYDCFDEKLLCCEDYDFWLRVAVSEPFLLIDAPLTIKEGGRSDQVSFKHRIGMDKYRIYALVKLLATNDLSSLQKGQAQEMLIKKCEIYGNGCLKHGKVSEGRNILRLAEDTKAEDL